MLKFYGQLNYRNFKYEFNILERQLICINLGKSAFVNLMFCVERCRHQKDESAVGKSQDGPNAKKHAGEKNVADKRKLDKKKSLKRL